MNELSQSVFNSVTTNLGIAKGRLESAIMSHDEDRWADLKLARLQRELLAANQAIVNALVNINAEINSHPHPY